MAHRKGLERPRPFKTRKKRYLIVCEGKVTEPSYLNGINRFWQSPAVLEFAPHEYTSPREIVRFAVQLKHAARQKSKSDPLQEFDSVWCFFDRDSISDSAVMEAFVQARDNDVKVAFSDPSFELWLLLHFQDQWAFLSRQEAASACREHMPGYKKYPDIAVLEPLCLGAATRAATLRSRQAQNENVRKNPWTEVDLFLELLRPK